MPQPLSRRTLLVGGSALAVMAACGRNGDSIEVGETNTTQRQRDLLQAVQAGFNFQTGIDERVTFALLQGIPATPHTGRGEVRVAFQKPGTEALTPAVVAEKKSAGIADRPYYVVHHRFDTPGNWGLQATTSGLKPANLVFRVDDPSSVKWPTPGKPLPRTKTPTPADPMNVDPICTRSEGTCPFHAASLDTLLTNGKPTVVLLATPALCKSATCGPVLDILMEEAAPHLAKLNVVHIEVFADETGKTPSPAFTAFNLLNEPVCYFADGSGIVTERFNGGFDKTEARAAIARLLA